MSAIYKTQFIIRNNKNFHTEIHLGSPWNIIIPWNNQMDLLEINPSSELDIKLSLKDGQLRDLVSSNQAIIVKNTIDKQPIASPGPEPIFTQSISEIFNEKIIVNGMLFQLKDYIYDKNGNQYIGTVIKDEDGSLYTLYGYKIN